MSAFWVDTDFGFDDLWALLVLRHLGARTSGISLVAGNAPLEQVTRNALGARRAYGFDAPLFRGAARPLLRAPETAERILGARGMRSRGRYLPDGGALEAGPEAARALQDWLGEDAARRDILAIGPLTNIARLIEDAPEAAARITRVIWMGGSAGAGNHSAQAEFNALADPEAAARVAGFGVPLDVVDLSFCRRFTFDAGMMPQCDGLTRDLLGGYLDIALERGREAMGIYDPLAALVAVQPEGFAFAPCDMAVSTRIDASYGKTTFTPRAESRTRLVTGANFDPVPACLNALPKSETEYDH
ncbi:nucleoside hydrolase [Alphaproteobacteria bacterium KMM 3653]|uniref:Nucleoside hydrolase n=1 Tax=Harenicola maris TaxID=2841044 RepID=A0AAP2G7P3_9RHOB|nr:nucleoside hydrolase [Harenicola maris]